MPIPYKHRDRSSPALRISTSTALLRRDAKLQATSPYTLCIDIGGTGIKMIVLDPQGEPINARARELTPKPATWSAVLELIRVMLRQQPRFGRISVGYPGVVRHGVTLTAANLDPSWLGKNLETELQRMTGAPTRVINDADLQGYGVIEGVGLEMVITLGTGVGSALFLDGRLVPNLELGHHPFQKDKTYEERLSDAQLKEHGKQKWSKRVGDMLETLSAIFNYDRLYIGGGNAEHIRVDLPDNVSLFDNVDGMTGGIALWEDES